VKAPYEPQNRLELLFAQAAQDPAARPEFYRQLFNFDLLVVGDLAPSSDGKKIAQFVTRENDKGPYVLAYTSHTALEWVLTRDEATPRPYIKMNARSIFSKLQGKLGVMLNGGLPWSKLSGP
jgi:hypothetical protein